jgi:hypothetical protein
MNLILSILQLFNKRFAYIFILSQLVFFVETFAQDATLKRYDPLAADDTAIYYRTGVMDSISGAVPLDIKNGIKSEPTIYLPKLVAFLVKNTDNPFLKLKRIHDWITDNIAYDTDLFLGLNPNGSRDAYELLKINRTTCGGFSSLFKEMAMIAGIETIKVPGYAKSYSRVSTGEIANHVWNASKINDKWYIIDCQARRGYKHGEFSEKRKYSDRKLFLKPEIKLVSNLPYNEDQQFIDNPISFETYRNSPRITSYFVGFNIQFVTDIKQLIKEKKEVREGGKLQTLYDGIDNETGEVLKIIFKAPDDFIIRSQLRDKDGNKFPHHVLTEYKNGQHICSFSPPEAGEYTVYFYGKKYGYNGNHLLYKVALSAGQKGPELPLESGKFYAQKLFSLNKLILNESNFTGEDNVYMMDVSYGEDKSVYASLIDDDNKAVSKSVSISYLKNRKRYYFKIPKDGTYRIKLYSKNKDSEGSHQYSGLVKIENAKENGDLSIPFNELIFGRRFVEQGMELISENISTGGENGLYTITVKSPNIEVDCRLRDKEKKNITSNYDCKKEGDIYTLYFSVPDSKFYKGQIYMVDEKGIYNTVASFKLKNAKKGPLLPLPQELRFTRSMKELGFGLLSSNVEVNDDKAYYILKIKAPDNFTMSAGLKDKNGERKKENYAYTFKEQIYTFYFSAPDKHRYMAEVYGINSEGRYRKVAYFAIENSKKQSQLPLNGILYLNNRFKEYGLKILEENVSTGGENGSYLIVIESKDHEISCRVYDENKKNIKDFYTTEEQMGISILKFNITQKGFYNAKIFITNKEGKKNLIGYFNIDNQ